MSHIGMDMHKKLSRVEAMDEEGQVIDQRVLFQHDQEKAREHFSYINQASRCVFWSRLETSNIGKWK